MMTEMGDCIHRSFFLQLIWFVGTISKELFEWTTALGLPTNMACSKTPPRPLREAFRMGMGRAGWESGYLFGRPPVTGWFQPRLIEEMSLDSMLPIPDDSRDERR